jgi:hypothetical protein
VSYTLVSDPRRAGLWAGTLALLVCAGSSGCENDDPDCGDDDPVEEPWLLAIDEDEGTIDALVQISVEPDYEGTVTVLCDDLALPSELPADTNFTSLAYHDGLLYASVVRDTFGDTLVRVDPCACSVTVVGGYGFTEVSGLASTGDRLFGLSSDLDVMLEIDPGTAIAEQAGPLGVDFGSHGLTYSSADDRLYGIDAQTDRLHRFRGSDGTAIDSIGLSADFLAVGVEWHPGRNEMFACGIRDHESGLVTVDLDSGLVQVVADSVFTTACDNLAGPSGPIYCE